MRKSAILLIAALLLVAAVSTDAFAANLIRNSSFECSVNDWMPMDAWLPSAVYDCPEALTAIPDVLKDGLVGQKFPNPIGQRTTEETHSGKYSCRLDNWYESAYSAYIRPDLPGDYVVSVWLKSSRADSEVKVSVVSAERGGGKDEVGWDKATCEVSQIFKLTSDWQRYSFTASLKPTGDGLDQVYFYLPPRREGDGVLLSDRYGQRVDLRPRMAWEKVWVDDVQLEKTALTPYTPAATVEAGARFLNTDDWIFVDGEQPVLELQSSSKGIKQFEIIISDWRRAEVLRKTVPVTAASAAAGVKLPIDLKRLGYFRAFIAARDTQGKRSRELELPFGIVQPQPKNVIAESSAFCAMLPVTHLYGSSWFKPGFHSSYYELDDRQIKSAEKIGIRWVKALDFISFDTWPCTEPVKGQFQWGDPSVRLIKKHGFEIYGKLVYTPGYAQGKYKDFHVGPPGDMAAWDEYVRKSLEHYRGDLAINYWGIWTEPFTKAFWQGTGQEYTDFLKHSYELAKSIDPKINICGINTCSPYYTYQSPGIIDDIFRAGASKYCDILTYHRPQDYGDRPDQSLMPDETNPTWAKDIETFREWMDRFGDGQRPIWNTEFRQYTASGYLDKTRFATIGYSADLIKSPDNAIASIEDSVDWVVRAHVVSMANGVEKVFTYGVAPCGVNFDQDSFIQMKEADGRPKPWMIAYGAMAGMLQGARGAGQIKIKDPRVACYAFRSGKDTVVVMWGLNTKVAKLYQDAEGTLTLPGVYRAVDVMGTTLSTIGAKRTVVPLRADPFYVVFKNTQPAGAKAILAKAKVSWGQMH